MLYTPSLLVLRGSNTTQLLSASLVNEGTVQILHFTLPLHIIYYDAILMVHENTIQEMVSTQQFM